MENKPVLDMHPIHPRQYQLPLDEQFDDLYSREGFALINDHDLKTCFYQLQAERDGEFRGHYFKQRPEAWRVRIGRVEHV